MEDLNKITSTRVGDNIHFFVNGAEDKGTVVKMDSKYVTVVKDDGNFQDIHINDTFFIKDIIVNKSWNDMTMEERTVELHKVHAYSPRFLAKTWKELPQSLKDVMKMKPWKANPRDPEASSIPEQVRRIQHDSEEKGETRGKKQGKKQGLKQGQSAILNAPKAGLEILQAGKKKSNVEQGHLGGGGRSSQVVETNTDFDAPDDYEGQTEDEKKEQFKHEAKKPQTTNKTSQEQLWEEWLDKGLGRNEGDTSPRTQDDEPHKPIEPEQNPQHTQRGHFAGKKVRRKGVVKESMGGGDSSPAQTSMTTGTTDVYNAVYGKDGRIKGQEKDKDEEETEKDKESKEKERKG